MFLVNLRKSRSLSKLFLSPALAAFISLAGVATAQVAPGTPSFSAYFSGPYYSLNLQNLNVSLNVPVMSKAGAFPFQFGLSGGDSFMVNNSGTLASGILTTPLADSVNGVLGYYALVAQPTSTTTGSSCPLAGGSGSYTKYSAWQLVSVSGTVHLLPSADAVYTGTNCNGDTVASDQVIDGTGYTYFFQLEPSTCRMVRS
jgi:hypothetical protein